MFEARSTDRIYVTFSLTTCIYAKHPTSNNMVIYPDCIQKLSSAFPTIWFCQLHLENIPGIPSKEMTLWGDRGHIYVDFQPVCLSWFHSVYMAQLWRSVTRHNFSFDVIHLLDLSWPSIAAVRWPPMSESATNKQYRVRISN